MMNKRIKTNIAEIFVTLLLILLFAGCHPGVEEDATKIESLTRLNPRQIPRFIDSPGYEQLVDSIDQSLVYFKRVPLDRSFNYGNDRYSAGHMIVSLEAFKAFIQTNPTPEMLQDFIRTRFYVYAALGDENKEVLFTGYYEPTYEGALEKSDQYPFALYSRPDDMLEINPADFSDKYKGEHRLMARVIPEEKKVVPYYSRKMINAMDDFTEKAKPVVWLKNRVDRFFLEIQGSGRIDLGNGEAMRVHYAGSNGNAYKSVGRYLIEKKEIAKENMSMQAIRTWLAFHPERIDEVLHYNESFVFFQKEEGGPFGSLGVTVTPFRSIATDSRKFPKGALCFVQAQIPDRVHINPIKEWEDASFFCLNQDTGGAIKGPARADIFCGSDNYAAYTAGHMNVAGKLYFLVLKKE